MGKLTRTTHGDAANNLVAFFMEKRSELKVSGQYFMAAVALALAVESMILAYLLVEFGEEDGSGELRIPDSKGLAWLIDEAHNLGVLSAPIDTPSYVRGDACAPRSVAKDAADKIKCFRRKIHPARALSEPFDPRSFGVEDLREVEELFESVAHSLVYNL